MHDPFIFDPSRVQVRDHESASDSYWLVSYPTPTGPKVTIPTPKDRFPTEGEAIASVCHTIPFFVQQGGGRSFRPPAPRLDGGGAGRGGAMSKRESISMVKALVGMGLIKLYTTTRDGNASPREYIEGFFVAGGPVKRINPRSRPKFEAGRAGSGIMEALNRQVDSMRDHQKLAWMAAFIRANPERFRPGPDTSPEITA